MDESFDHGSPAVGGGSLAGGDLQGSCELPELLVKGVGSRSRPSPKGQRPSVAAVLGRRRHDVRAGSRKECDAEARLQRAYLQGYRGRARVDVFGCRGDAAQADGVAEGT